MKFEYPKYDHLRWSELQRKHGGRSDMSKRIAAELARDPWRPSDWGDCPTEFEKNMAEEMAKSFEKSREVTSEQTRRIDEDVALLLLAGVSFHRITIATYQDEPLKRSIMVDGKSVRDYTIKVVAEE